MDRAGSLNSDALPPYSVRCLDLDPVGQADGHRHVTAIETWDPDGGQTRWTLVQAIEAVRDGERFVTEGGADGQLVELAPTVCPQCAVATLSATSEVQPQPSRQPAIPALACRRVIRR